MSNDFTKQKEAKLLWLAQAEVIKARNKLETDLLQSTINDAIGFWVIYVTRCRSLVPETIRNYQNYLSDLIEREVIPLKDGNAQTYTTGQIADLYSEICKRLDASKDLSINEKKYRLNALMAFSQFLEDVTTRKISKIIAPLSFGLGSTDRKPAPLILSLKERRAIVEEVRDISTRDHVIIRLVMSTGRNLNKILGLQMSDLDLENAVVYFHEQHGTLIRIKIDKAIWKGLRDYVAATRVERKDDTVFITRAGSPVYRTHFQHILDKASEKAGLGFKVTMTMLQWSEVADSMVSHQCKEKVLDEFKLQSLPKFLEAAVKRKHRK